MENHSNGCEAKSIMGGAERSEVKVMDVSPFRSNHFYDILLRIMGLAFTLIATIVVGIDKETKIISISLIKSLPPLHLQATAKWQYMSALQYFVVSNGIACSYAALSLAYSIAARGYKYNSTGALALIVSDLVAMSLLSSANGASAAVGVIGQNGNVHMEWRKVCTFFQGYCHHFTAALALSIASCIIFVLLLILSILNLQKHSK